jgi:hypothetical protein
MSSRSRRRAGFRDKVVGIALAALGLALVAALAITVIWVKERRVVLATNNCPLSGPRAVHVILIDRSDPVSGQQAQHIRQVIQRLKVDAAFGTRFDIYTFEGDSMRELRPVLSICAPGRPQEANEFIENPERVHKRYEETFSAVVDKVIGELLRESTQPNSPIIESLKAAAQTSFGPFDPGQIPLRATLVSDMVQNTQAMSHFHAEPNFRQFSMTNRWASVRPYLKGADVFVLYLLRPVAVRGGVPIQNRGHQAFWEMLIEESGGRVMEFDPF